LTVIFLLASTTWLLVRLHRLLALAELLEQVAERRRDIVGVGIAFGGGGLAGDGHHGGAHPLHQIGEAEGRAVFQHARGARIAFIGGDHGRFAGNLDMPDGWQQGKGAKADHDDGGGAAQRDGAALAEGGLGKT
jgi:hypothetical protein